MKKCVFLLAVFVLLAISFFAGRITFNNSGSSGNPYVARSEKPVAVIIYQPQKKPIPIAESDAEPHYGEMRIKGRL